MPKSVLGLFNFFLVQWTGMRLTKVRQYWGLLRWVWPLTGWWGRYYWIYRVWPSAESELVDAIAQQIAKEIDDAIVKDLFESAPVIKGIDWPPPPPLPPEDEQ